MLNFVPGFQKFPEVEINLTNCPHGTYLDKETGEKLFIFSNYDDINGDVLIRLNESSNFDHAGVFIELIGVISSKIDDYKSEFLNMNKELESVGQLTKSMTYSFSFKKVNLNYESFNGNSITVKVTIIKKIFSTKLSIEKQFIVYNPQITPELNANLKMEVGLSNLIHLEYEIYKSKFHLDEFITGKIYFLKVNMKVKTVEIHLIKRESIGSGINQKLDISLISKFEVIDGNPASGEIVPIRMFINSYDLSPTYRDINNIMSVKYYLKFVVIDEDDKSFFKQQEIILWRKSIKE